MNSFLVPPNDPRSSRRQVVGACRRRAMVVVFALFLGFFVIEPVNAQQQVYDLVRANPDTAADPVAMGIDGGLATSANSSLWVESGAGAKRIPMAIEDVTTLCYEMIPYGCRDVIHLILNCIPMRSLDIRSNYIPISIQDGVDKRGGIKSASTGIHPATTQGL